MPGTKNRSDQTPANARVRRQAHLERDAEIKARKRLRRRRGEIHRAMEHAQKMVSEQVTTIEAPKPYRAADKRDDSGWRILDASGAIVAHGRSRDKARAEAKAMSEGDDHYVIAGVDPTYPTTDDAMFTLGFERVAPNDHKVVRPGWVGTLPVEEKFRRVVA